ncbi:MAG: hypothetical protein M3083_22160 [Actinomycetota bacterium]|nr:hypothetical protein [Actinomycetota bacterium]
MWSLVDPGLPDADGFEVLTDRGCAAADELIVQKVTGDVADQAGPLAEAWLLGL